MVQLPLGLRSASAPQQELEERDWTDQGATERASRASRARQASGRRRFVDPTTCERDYNLAELEFMKAMQEYKLSSGRMFPTWSEILEVLQNLGYEKMASEELAAPATSRPDAGRDKPISRASARP
jgi:hypothetical protein